MSYQVIARRYRPQKFEDVVGQEHITKTLKNAIETSRVHHAYLFTGARGIGKTTVARILAKAFNCEKGPIAEPCGECVYCKEIVNGNSLDVQEIDGASNTGVDDVREIRERAKYMPSSGRYKIYIIDEVHMLSTPAFNALLKILEEPPPHVIFIFATTEAHKIPVTILSRCQRYDFRRIPVTKIADTLRKIAEAEGVTIGGEPLLLIAHEAEGSMRDAESLLDQAIAFSGQEVKTGDIESMLGFLDRKLVFDLLDAVIEKDAKRALAHLNEVFDIGADLIRFSMDFLCNLRHLLVIKECGNQKNLIDLPQDELNSLNQLASKTSLEELHQMFQLWYAAADGVARSPFPKMLLEVLLMRIVRVEPVKQVAELLAEVEALAKQENRSQKSEVGSQNAEVRIQNTEVRSQNTEDRIQKSENKEQITVGESRITNHESRITEFISWLTSERPQIASIFQHSTSQKIIDNVIELTFDNPFYAGMLEETDRKSQIEDLMKKFFKKEMTLVIKKISEKKIGQTIESAVADKRVLTKKALESDIVREAAKILNAELHEVKINRGEV